MLRSDGLVKTRSVGVTPGMVDITASNAYSDLTSSVYGLLRKAKI
jgi:hypothetical protein